MIEKYVPEAARTWAISRFSADDGETQAGGGSGADVADAFTAAGGVPGGWGND